MSDADLANLEDRWRFAVRRQVWRNRTGEACKECGEWIGHFGGSVDRDPCSCIPLGVPLEEVRTNCYQVRAEWLVDRIRHVTEGKQ